MENKENLKTPEKIQESLIFRLKIDKRLNKEQQIDLGSKTIVYLTAVCELNTMERWSLGSPL